MTDRAEGTRRVYSIDPKGLGALRRYLDQFWDQALEAFAAEVEKDVKQEKGRMMDRTIAIAPVRKSLRVNAPPARDFEVFTAGMSRWWPATLVLKSPFKEAVIEPREGGRWYHVGEDGSECETGLVQVWDPPGRVVLIWQLNHEMGIRPEAVHRGRSEFRARRHWHASRTRASQHPTHGRRCRNGARAGRRPGRLVGLSSKKNSENPQEGSA